MPATHCRDNCLSGGLSDADGGLVSSSCRCGGGSTGPGSGADRGCCHNCPGGNGSGSSSGCGCKPSGGSGPGAGRGGLGGGRGDGRGGRRRWPRGRRCGLWRGGPGRGGGGPDRCDGAARRRGLSGGGGPWHDLLHGLDGPLLHLGGGLARLHLDGTGAVDLDADIVDSLYMACQAVIHEELVVLHCPALAALPHMQLLATVV
mmetsp:Transcript_84917/g.235508  ORF Transcript_84917/g.235508 Transcript_84917/m.235508 type:complete len:203 (+) Transcript_84917:153-761(+)